MENEARGRTFLGLSETLRDENPRHEASFVP